MHSTHLARLIPAQHTRAGRHTLEPLSIAANRYKGIRATLCTTIEHAKMARKHNDSNVLALGARTTDLEQLKSIVDTWLITEFEGGRHQSRIDLIDQV